MRRGRRALDDSRCGPGVGKAAGLEGDLRAGRQEAGELVPVVAGPQVLEHGLAGHPADEASAVQLLAKANISAAVVLPRPNFLLRSGKTEVSRRKTFE